VTESAIFLRAVYKRQEEANYYRGMEVDQLNMLVETVEEMAAHIDTLSQEVVQLTSEIAELHTELSRAEGG
jgi:uncharacterized coiled-coil DUF342 family protein